MRFDGRQIAMLALLLGLAAMCGGFTSTIALIAATWRVAWPEPPPPAVPRDPSMAPWMIDHTDGAIEDIVSALRDDDHPRYPQAVAAQVLWERMQFVDGVSREQAGKLVDAMTSCHYRRWDFLGRGRGSQPNYPQMLVRKLASGDLLEPDQLRKLACWGIGDEHGASIHINEETDIPGRCVVEAPHYQRWTGFFRAGRIRGVRVDGRPVAMKRSETTPGLRPGGAIIERVGPGQHSIEADWEWVVVTDDYSDVRCYRRFWGDNEDALGLMIDSERIPDPPARTGRRVAHGIATLHAQMGK